MPDNFPLQEAKRAREHFHRVVMQAIKLANRGLLDQAREIIDEFRQIPPLTLDPFRKCKSFSELKPFLSEIEYSKVMAAHQTNLQNDYSIEDIMKYVALCRRLHSSERVVSGNKERKSTLRMKHWK
jgi:hypothetical protein